MSYLIAFEKENQIPNMSVTVVMYRIVNLEPPESLFEGPTTLLWVPMRWKKIIIHVETRNRASNPHGLVAGQLYFLLVIQLACLY